MFCDGNCLDEESGKRCGLLWDIDIVDKDGKTRKETACGFLTIAGELISIRSYLLGIQQATESRRNNDAKIGIAAVNAIDKGFKRMAKVALVREVPALAILEDEDE